MPKSKSRRKKKLTQVDTAGHLVSSHTKKHIKDISRKVMYRNMMFHEAARSLSLKEWEELVDKAEARRDSTEIVKEAKPVLSYVRSVMDENNVPIEADTKEIVISNADISRLRAVLETKRAEQKDLESQEETK